ncbi:hypothetical protein KIW84_044910 [Lathyrus oleraceus]|uniref:BRCT domain-containing protein n=1 Tax=Pisum sativum TaxID=3888 RepID=A0A9D4XHL7_PEA|nr:hypothetical protein KIW84_044910 [Pisum sativum]
MRLFVLNGDSVSVHGVILVVRCPSLLPSEALSSSKRFKEITNHFVGETVREVRYSSHVDYEELLLVSEYVYWEHLHAAEEEIVKKLKILAKRFVKIRNARESFTSHKAICGALLAWQLRDSSELEEFDGTLVHFIYSASIGLNHEGDKYKVAKHWGHIHIVTMKWFDQSVARRTCLNEESYPVQNGSLSSRKATRDLTVKHSQDRDIGKMQSGSSSRAADSNMPVSDCAESMDVDLETTQSEHMSSFSNVPLFVKEADAEAPTLQTSDELNLDGAAANDSESDDNDLYLAECRILLAGFEASEMRKLVNMVRKGGGSRYMYFNDKLTHIVIGNPTEIEKKEVRSIAALGVVYVVKTSWLEDCDRVKKQVPVLRRHIACDLFLPKANSVKGAVTGIMPMDQSKSSSIRQSFQTNQVAGIKDFGVTIPESLDKNKQEKHSMGMNVVKFGKASDRTMPQTQHPEKN